MLGWEKSLKLRTRYITKDSRKNSNKEIHMEYVMHDDRISNPMKIFIPNTNDYIIVDAEFMKSACEKVLAMRKI